MLRASISTNVHVAGFEIIAAAASLEHPDAMREMARSHTRPYFGRYDVAVAKKWMKSLAAISASGSYEYALWLMSHELDLDDAEDSLRNAIAAEHPFAEGALAALDALKVELGITGPLKDAEQAELVARLRLGAKSGDSAATFMLGRETFYGKFGLSTDEETGHAMMMRAGTATEGENFYGPAASYFGWKADSLPHLKAAAEAGQPFDQVEFGKHLAETGQHAAGLAWLHVAADDGNAWALIELSYVFQEGLYGQRRSAAESFRYVLRAEATGHPAGQTELAKRYVTGVGVGRDRKLGANKLKDLASRMHYKPAMYCMAICYLNGWGVDRNQDAAKTWLQLTNGYPQALAVLAKLKEKSFFARLVGDWSW